MKSDDVQRRALRTAAKVAFVATQAACARDTSEAAHAEPAPMSDKQCLDAAYAHENGAARSQGGIDRTAPPALQKCCSDWFEKRNKNPNMGGGYDACCSVLGTMEGACYPWGPPSPPAFRA